MSQLWGLFGGAEGTRTPDPLHAKQVLSQLSYSPTNSGEMNEDATRNNLLTHPTITSGDFFSVNLRFQHFGENYSMTYLSRMFLSVNV